MKIYKSITFKLFTLLTMVLTVFLCLFIIVQTFVVGRSYMVSEFALERKEQLILSRDSFLNNINMNMLNNPRSKLGDESNLFEMERFEYANNIYLMMLDENLENYYITDNTRNTIKPDYINFIRQKSKELNLGGKTGSSLFRVYNKFNLPTKYTAFITPYHGPRAFSYVVTIIPEVFTTKSSKTVKDYMVYLFIALIVLITSVSGLASYFVARPVLKINKTASKIAALDFTEKCQVNSGDELGNLAQTINHMAHNLQKTLSELYAANTKLKKDLDLQKELDHLRQEFIAAVTHEFKTPITLIRGYTESIMDDVAEGEEKQNAFNTIIAETESMDKLVRDLLDLSKLEAVGYKLAVSKFCIDELLEETAKKYEKVINEKNIRLIQSFESRNEIVMGDSFRIGQVVKNFINNAVENTPAGKEIIISLKKNNVKISISIQNQGKNIEESELSRIWEKFYRIEKSRNKKLGGTGLGLAISKSILELHKSDYGVRNTEDGVEFFFSLELAGKP